MKIHLVNFLTLCICLNIPVINAQSVSQGSKDTNNKIRNSELKGYPEVIPKNAETQNGLFTFHKVGNQYYFEIPESLLEKEILVATKVSGHALNEGSLGAGNQPHPQQIIRFQKKDNIILMRLVSYDAVADKELPIYQSVRNNNFEPIVYNFKIEALGKGLDSYIIDVKDFFTTEIQIIGGLTDFERKKYGISSVDQSRSFINCVKVFPGNVEVRHVLTYKGSKLPNANISGFISLELNQSFILLPKDPMVSRFYNERIGYISFSQIDYSLEDQGTVSRKYILRRRLIPSDWEAYKNGELVDPVRPLIYYIDPATPIKWRKYIKQGVEEWQKAFERIGFKNAIIARDAPTLEEDPDWDPEDIRYSVIRYLARNNQSANGPSIYDPRTGEIIESDILFNHNMMKLLGNWFFVRTAAANPSARPVRLEDEVMGKLIQGVITHEVGHTLGLMHNGISPAGYPIDSLRSPTFTSKYGSGESIMDHTYNYIAQPGDNIADFYNHLGAYDYWAIEYGYRLIPDVQGPMDEEDILKKWIKIKEDNPVYRYSQTMRLLGSNQMEAADLAIRNLKNIMDSLYDWTVEEKDSHRILSERYKGIVQEYQDYMYAVSYMIERIDYFGSAERGEFPQVIPYETQKKAIDFLNNQLFQTPNWLIDKEVMSLAGLTQSDGPNTLKRVQINILSTLMELSKKISENEVIYAPSGYSVIDLFSDLKKGIFSELSTGKPIDPYRRHLQMRFVGHLESIVNDNDRSNYTDLPSIARANLISLRENIKNSLPSETERISRYHLKYLMSRIEKTLNVN